MKTIVHFGAGNIGRSLVGSLFSAAGYRVVFVDVAAGVIDALNVHGRYTVRVRDSGYAGPDSFIVENVCGVLSTDEARVIEQIARADVLSTAVGLGVFPKILPLLARGLLARSAPVSILFCENIHDVCVMAREGLRAHLPDGYPLATMAGLVPTSIGKMVPLMPQEVRERDPLEVWAEGYNKIIADAGAWVGEPLAVAGVEFAENFSAYVDRKLFIHNLGHAATAYYGGICGKALIADAITTPWIQHEVKAAMREAAEGILAAYPRVFTAEEMSAHIADLLVRFGNCALQDTVFRVGRDLSRKLAAGDRFLGAVRLCQRCGRPVGSILRAIAAGLSFHGVDESGFPFPADVQFQRRLQRDGVAAILAQVCGLDEGDEFLRTQILMEYEKIQALIHARGLSA